MLKSELLMDGTKTQRGIFTFALKSIAVVIWYYSKNQLHLEWAELQIFFAFNFLFLFLFFFEL